MKTIIIILLAVIAYTGLYAQESNNSNYYYYKGEKQYLTLDKSRLNVTVSDDFQNGNLLESDFTTLYFETDSSNIPKTFGILEFETALNDMEYHQKIENLMGNENIIAVHPNYLTKENISIGMSSYFYVKLKNISDYDVLLNLVEEKKVRIIEQNIFMPLWYTLQCTKETSENTLSIANYFFETGLFASSFPDFLSDDVSCTNDPDFSQLWGLQNNSYPGIDINACNAWTIAKGTGIKVAVLDQGIALTHIDLASNISPLSYNTETNTSPSQIFGDHGTHCAGTIGAVGNNNIQIVGVAPECTLMSVSNSLASTPNSRMKRADGINWACSNGADIISNSWGSSVQYDVIDDAIDNALVNGRNGKGCIVIFAAGNDYSSTVAYPANVNLKIITVGAIGMDGRRANFSNYGTVLDVVAPGVDILSTIPNNGTTIKSGTSMATPHVAGVAALILSVNPNLTGQQVRDIIESTAQKVGGYTYQTYANHPNGTWINDMGYGLVDAYAAVSMAACYPTSEIVQTRRISGNDTWNTDKHVIGSVSVESGATLTIQNTTIKFISNAKIIVEPGGRLILNACTLTNACYGKLWQGIEVLGNPSNNYQTSTYQGALEMLNGASIENAECAISVGTNGIKGGGIITAKNSTFKNNRQAVNYHPYTTISSNGNELVNMGAFTACDFITDNDALFPASILNIMVYLSKVRGIAFNGCTFKDTRQKNSSSDYGIGIYANAASISMECLGLPRFGIILDPSFVPSKVNEFSGFGKAILMKDAGTKASKVHWTNFENNNIAIYGSLVNKLSVISCAIDLSDPAGGTMSGRHGIYIEYSDGYTITNNQFKGNGTGLRIKESGQGNNFVENNTFSCMSLAILASGINGNGVSSTYYKGLTFHCNKFISNCEDIRVDDGKSCIRFLQGSEYNAAGNLFYCSTIALNNTSSEYYMAYYYNNNVSNQYPTGYSTNKLFTGTTPYNNCNGVGYLGNYYYSRGYRVTVSPGTGSVGAIIMSYTSSGMSTNTGYSASLTDGTTSDDGYVETLDLPSIMNAYTEIYNESNAELTAKINTYNASYSEPINWDAVSLGVGEGAVDNPQVKLCVEISNLAQEVRLICREAISFLLTAKEFDRPTYNVWLERENTMRSYYLLAESYVEQSNGDAIDGEGAGWEQVNNVLQAIPEKFPTEYIESEHNGFVTCLQFENQWGNTHPLEIPESEIAIMESYLGIFNGSALAKLIAILELLKELYFYTSFLDDKSGSGDCCINCSDVEGFSVSNNHKSINSSNGNEQSLDDADSYSLAIYPNPSNGALHLNLEKTTTVNIQQVDVYDIYGRELRKVENIGVHRTTVNLSGLSNGIYFIRVSMDNGETKIRRIVKE
jgi:parallel beta-helix repeat protein